MFCNHPGSSAVTSIIISCCIRRRSRKPSLESKLIPSTVCRCPISSFSFISEPNFLKEDETARAKFIFIKLTTFQSINPVREPENSVKLRKSLSFIFHFRTSRSTEWHTRKNVAIFFWFVNSTFDWLRRFLSSRTQNELPFFLFRWRTGQCALF